jgi:hypothetical protein
MDKRIVELRLLALASATCCVAAAVAGNVFYPAVFAVLGALAVWASEAKK